MYKRQEKGFSENYAQRGARRSGSGVKEMAEKAQAQAAQERKASSKKTK